MLLEHPYSLSMNDSEEEVYEVAAKKSIKTFYNLVAKSDNLYNASINHYLHY